MVAEKLCIGVITSAHGIRGLVRIKPFTDKPENVAAYGPVMLKSGQVFEISYRGMNKGTVLACLDGIASRDAAETLRGEEIFIDKAMLPELATDSIYQTDLIGRIVEDPTYGEIGIVNAVFDFGGGALLEVRRPENTLVLLPFGNTELLEITDDRIRLGVDPVWLEE